jgi:acyl dehydratase
MLTMGLALAPVQSWLGGSGVVKSYSVRFTKPVYVPAQGAIEVGVKITVAKIDDPEPGQVTLGLQVTTPEGATVLGKAFAVVAPR